jgi:hypothetical protein
MSGSKRLEAETAFRTALHINPGYSQAKHALAELNKCPKSDPGLGVHRAWRFS